MKRLRRLWAFLICALVLLTLVPAGATPPQPDRREGTLTVLFTHDTHDHFYPDANGIGGYTRLATAVGEQQEAASRADIPTVTLDAGDFSMGSLFQSIYATDAPELVALGAMGYDVTTLGNHEFDYRQQGLADMLNAAKAKGVTLPQIVQANYTVPVGGDAPEALSKALADYPVTPYTVIEKGDVKVGVFGVLGVDADQCAPMSYMTFEPIADAARRVVADLQKEGVDFIICLSHAGTTRGKGEDYELAQKVPGIDLIVSGHTHTTLSQPIQVGNTYIVSCGPYTQNLGRIVLHKSSDGRQGACAASDYALISLDGSVPADPAIEELTERFKKEVDRAYLSNYDLEYDQVLATAASDLDLHATGDYVGAAYMGAIEKLEGEAYVPIALAVAPSGVVRDTIRQGGVTTAQAFDVLSLGSGADGSPGYPLVSVYLTGKDLKNVYEVDASISPLMPAAEIFGAGSYWRVNPHRVFLDRVAECQIVTQDPRGEDPIAGPPADNKLYRVVADLYSGQMLSAVKDKSFGLLSITPRDENGQPVTDFESRVIRDKDGRELKAWYALASYLKDQGTVERPPVSKRMTPSWNPLDLVWNAGWPTAVVLALAALALLAVVLILRRVIRAVKRRNGGYRPYQGRHRR